MKTNSQPLFRSAAAVALSALFLAACSGGKEQGGAPGAGGPPPAPAVSVMTLKSESVPMVVELPGRTTPYLIAELRPQVTGIVTERAFNEGSEVKAGQVLYRIDPAPYQAAFDSAKAALARAELSRARAEQQEVAARQQLAALWGERAPRFDIAPADPLALPDIADAADFAALLDGTPELAQFADERRVREARVRLARTAAIPDVDWQVGVRRLQEGGDMALVGGVSLPLGGARRAGPEIRSTEADLAALEIARDSRDIALYSTLADAHGRYRVAQLDVQRTRADVLTRLLRAEQAAERAYRAGAISYLEWAQLQSETTATRRQQLDAALDAQAALIEIQRLTGQAFVAAPAASQEGTAP